MTRDDIITWAKDVIRRADNYELVNTDDYKLAYAIIEAEGITI